MKIIEKRRPDWSTGHTHIEKILYYEYIEYDYHSYKRVVSIDGEISWKFVGLEYHISYDNKAYDFKKEENMYQNLIRKRKLNNILNGNY
jgi:hypothetical protein